MQIKYMRKYKMITDTKLLDKQFDNNFSFSMKDPLLGPRCRVLNKLFTKNFIVDKFKNLSFPKFTKSNVSMACYRLNSDSYDDSGSIDFKLGELHQNCCNTTVEAMDNSTNPCLIEHISEMFDISRATLNENENNNTRYKILDSIISRTTSRSKISSCSNLSKRDSINSFRKSLKNSLSEKSVQQSSVHQRFNCFNKAIQSTKDKSRRVVDAELLKKDTDSNRVKIQFDTDELTDLKIDVETEEDNLLRFIQESVKVKVINKLTKNQCAREDLENTDMMNWNEDMSSRIRSMLSEDTNPEAAASKSIKSKLCIQHFAITQTTRNITDKFGRLKPIKSSKAEKLLEEDPFNNKLEIGKDMSSCNTISVLIQPPDYYKLAQARQLPTKSRSQEKVYNKGDSRRPFESQSSIDSIMSSANLGIICYLCGKQFSSYSIHIHYHTCRKKWERIIRILGCETVIPNMPEPTEGQLKQKIAEAKRLDSLKVYSIRDAFNDIMEESSKINQLKYKKLILN